MSQIAIGVSLYLVDGLLAQFEDMSSFDSIDSVLDVDGGVLA